MAANKRVGKSLAEVEAELASPVEETLHVRPVGDGRKSYVFHTSPEGLHFCAYEGGGEVPDVLKGRYTRRQYLEAAIAAYLAERDSA